MPIPYINTGPIDCTVTPDVTDLKGKSVIVTGGSSGLGAAYVKEFAKAGAFVTNADIKPAADGFERPNAQFIQCDVRSWNGQVSVFKAAAANSPNNSIDIVVANAGVSGSDSVFQLDEGDEPTEPDLRITNINLVGVIYTTKLAMHYFNKQAPSPSRDRCLILKASLAGYVDVIGSPSYESAKFGVRGLMCNLRRTDRLRVNVIAPWFIATPLMSDIVVEKLGGQLQGAGSEFAQEEDSVKAVIRVAADTSINGRGFGIVPRNLVPHGYVDLERDDYEKGTLLGNLQSILTGITHRTLPKEQQAV